jgi:hypothetical protein
VVLNSAKPRITKGTVGVTAAPTPVNTTSLRNDKSKDSHASLVPVGNNVWGHNSGGNETNESSSGEGDRSQTRPAPWTSKSQPGTDVSSSIATTTVTPSEVVKENKRRSWADSDDDDEDDDVDDEVVEPTPPEKFAPTPYVTSTPHERHERPASLPQDVRYSRDRDAPPDHRSGNNRTFVRDSFPPSRNQHQPPVDREMPRGGRYEPNQPVSPLSSV